jgi:hypothetical protein
MVRNAPFPKYIQKNGQSFRKCIDGYLAINQAQTQKQASCHLPFTQTRCIPSAMFKRVQMTRLQGDPNDFTKVISCTCGIDI